MPCTEETHDRDCSTLQRFERGCENVRPWPDEPMLIGECKKCHSSLAFDLSENAARLTPYSPKEIIEREFPYDAIDYFFEAMMLPSVKAVHRSLKYDYIVPDTAEIIVTAPEILVDLEDKAVPGFRRVLFAAKPIDPKIVMDLGLYPTTNGLASFVASTVPAPIELGYKDPSRGIGPVLISKDTYPGSAGYRITYFDEKFGGPTGHSEFSSLEKAIEAALNEGYRTLFPGIVDRILVKNPPGFSENPHEHCEHKDYDIVICDDGTVENPAIEGRVSDLFPSAVNAVTKGCKELYGKNLKDQLGKIPLSTNSRLGRVLGRTFFSEEKASVMRIELSLAYVNGGDSKRINNTMVHELCHAARMIIRRADYPDEDGHGLEWQRLMVASGAKPNKYSGMSDEQEVRASSKFRKKIEDVKKSILLEAQGKPSFRVRGVDDALYQTAINELKEEGHSV